MHFKKTKIIIILICLLIFASGAFGLQYFPYITGTLALPGIDNPYPGLGTNYSSLGKGIRTILWNPASLAKTEKAEAYLGLSSTMFSSQVTKNYQVEDQTFTMGGDIDENMTNKVLFTDDVTETNATTREFAAPGTYSPSSAKMNYNQAIKIGDFLSLGISSRGDTNMSFAMGGNFPTQYLSEMNLYNSNDLFGSGISVGSDGKLTFTQTSPAPFVYTSEASAWSGFLSQSQRIPFSVISDMRNDVKVDSNLTFSGATKWNDLSIGINFTPISAGFNVNNTAKAIVNSGTSNPYFYTPNFNPTNEADVAAWVSDPTKYGTESGYNKSYIEVPAGESIGEAKYTGFYNASTIRTDIGMMYDFGDILTFGAALENAGAASLNMKGTGQVAYVYHRINTNESISIDPTNNQINWNLFSDTFLKMEGTENIGMLSEIGFDLPQRTKLGITFHKPILISLDYELQKNPIKIRYQNQNGEYVDAEFSNIQTIRCGLETQVFAFPVWLRGGISLLLKPTASGLDSTSQSTYNNTFSYGLLPLSLDLNMITNLWGYKLGGTMGFDASTVLSALQMDTLNYNFGKTMYYSISLNKDNWHCVMQNNLDIISTSTAYSNAKTAGTITEKSEWTNYITLLKWTSTLTFGFDF